MAYIYLLQDGRDKGTNIYKVGKTTQEGDSRKVQRLQAYSPDTVVYSLQHVPLEQVHAMERKIKQAFEQTYELVRGTEWFAGDVQRMKRDMDRMLETWEEEVQEGGEEEIGEEVHTEEPGMHTCRRCGYNSEDRSHFLRHLKRKNPCRAILEDVSVEDMLKEYGRKYNEVTHDCACGKRYNSRQGLYLHKRKCRVEPKSEVQELREQVEELRRMVLQMVPGT